MKIPIPAFTWIDVHFGFGEGVLLFYILSTMLFYCSFWYWNRRYKLKDFNLFVNIVLSMFWLISIPILLEMIFEMNKPKKRIKQS